MSGRARRNSKEKTIGAKIDVDKKYAICYQMSMEEIETEAARQVIEKGSVVIELHDGKRLFIIASHLMHMDVNGFLVSLEGRASYFWDARTHLTKWTLVGAGFSGFIASIVVSVIQRILQHRMRATLAKPRTRRRQE